MLWLLLKSQKSLYDFVGFVFLRYDDYDVPDTMNVHGIYDTKASMVTFESRSEFQKYLQEEAGVSGSYFGFYAGVKVGWGESETQASQKYMALLHVDINRYIETLFDCYFPLLLWFKVVPSFLYKYSTGGGSRERVWWVRIFARLGNLLAARDYVLFGILIGRCCCISFITRGNPTCDDKLFGERPLSTGPRLRFFDRNSFFCDS